MATESIDDAVNAARSEGWRRFLARRQAVEIAAQQNREHSAGWMEFLRRRNAVEATYRQAHPIPQTAHR